MKPEEFDLLIKNKIDGLTSMPGLDCSQEQLWQQVDSRINKDTNGYKVWSIVCLLFIFIIAVLWQWNKEPDSKPKSSSAYYSSVKAIKQIAVTKNKNKKQLLRKRLNQTVIVRSNRFHTQEKKDLGTNDSLPVPSGRGISTMVVPSSPIHSKIDSRVSYLVTQQNELERADRMISRDTIENTITEKNTLQEFYSNFLPQGSIAGIRWMQPLSHRLSFGYGIGASQAFYQPMDEETPYQLSIPILQIPVELRYYLLPRENRFTLFMYTTVKGIATPYTFNLALEGGTEMRYQLGKKPRVFLFARMPLYRQTLFSSGKKSLPGQFR